MRHVIIAALLLLTLGQGVALADGTPFVIPPPPADICQIQAPSDCRKDLDSCQGTLEGLVTYVQKQCPVHLTKEQIIERVRTPVKKGPPKKADGGHKPKSPSVAVPKSSLVIKMERFKARKGCSGGGLLFSTSLDGKVTDTAFVCDGAKGEKGDRGPKGERGEPGKPGDSGRPGLNGNTRVQFGLGGRTSAIWSKGRPTGYSLAPETALELWLAPTVEFVSGLAWAPGGDRNMVVTGQLRYRGLGKRIGLGFGIQYQAWNLEGNKALWQSVLGMAALQLVLLDTKHVDISAEAGLLLGLDGYDTAAQFAFGGTFQLSAALKF